VKVDEIRNFTADELEDKADQLRKELYVMRVRGKVGKLEKSSKMRLLRRDLARMLTVRREWSVQNPKTKKKKERSAVK